MLTNIGELNGVVSNHNDLDFASGYAMIDDVFYDLRDYDRLAILNVLDQSDVFVMLDYMVYLQCLVKCPKLFL